MQAKEIGSLPPLKYEGWIGHYEGWKVEKWVYTSVGNFSQVRKLQVRSRGGEESQEASNNGGERERGEGGAVSATEKKKRKEGTGVCCTLHIDWSWRGESG